MSPLRVCYSSFVARAPATVRDSRVMTSRVSGREVNSEAAKSVTRGDVAEFESKEQQPAGKADHSRSREARDLSDECRNPESVKVEVGHINRISGYSYWFAR